MDTTFDQTPEQDSDEAPIRELRSYTNDELLDELKLRFSCCSFIAVEFGKVQEDANPDDDCRVFVRMYADMAQALGMSELIRMKTVDLYGL